MILVENPKMYPIIFDYNINGHTIISVGNIVKDLQGIVFDTKLTFFIFFILYNFLIEKH